MGSISTLNLKRTFIFSKKKKPIEKKDNCPPTHEEIPQPSTFLQNLAIFTFGAFMGNLMDNYGRPTYRYYFPDPPCDLNPIEEEICPYDNK
ncbi:hypothetical protein RN001_014969 [Aquatica leii]|uniref:Uncharacterized protein n=1 Tax=Aquatica leii TaxID=1421715 RepID=A0AAN7SNC2_9COLE|nr:hypothetical protein RN001_014969 [Aquatica leii]